MTNNSTTNNKISLPSGDDREASSLFQQMAVLIQRFNAILLHDSFAKEDGCWPFQLLCIE